MTIHHKTIWLENIVLFNKCVQESGGIMEIKSSYTDYEGDVLVRVCYTQLNREKANEYELKRKRFYE